MLSSKPQNISELAKLELSEDDSKEFQKDFEEVLAFVSIINMLEISNVLPLTRIPEEIQFSNPAINENPLNRTEVFANRYNDTDESSLDYFIIKQNKIKGKNNNEL